MLDGITRDETEDIVSAETAEAVNWDVVVSCEENSKLGWIDRRLLQFPFGRASYVNMFVRSRVIQKGRYATEIVSNDDDWKKTASETSEM